MSSRDTNAFFAHSFTRSWSDAHTGSSWAAMRGHTFPELRSVSANTHSKEPRKAHWQLTDAFNITQKSDRNSLPEQSVTCPWLPSRVPPSPPQPLQKKRSKWECVTIYWATSTKSGTPGSILYEKETYRMCKVVWFVKFFKLKLSPSSLW